MKSATDSSPPRMKTSSGDLSGPRCRSGKECGALTKDGPALTGGVIRLCSVCVAKIQRCLEELPHLEDAVRTFLNPGMKVAYESKVNATREPAAPINLHVLDLLQEIQDAYDYADDRRVADLVRRPAELFTVWIKGAEQRAYLDGVDRALRIHRIHKKVSNTVGLDPVFQRRVAPCPECGLPTLGQWTGSDRVQCSNEDCLASFPIETYEQYVIEKANE